MGLCLGEWPVFAWQLRLGKLVRISMLPKTDKKEIIGVKKGDKAMPCW